MTMRSDRGFTLMELIIILAIIGTLAAISIPNLMSQIPRWHANGTTRELAAKLMMARLKAIQTNRRYGIRFDTGDIDTFWLQRCDSNAILPAACDNWVDENVKGKTTLDVDIVPGGNCGAGHVEFRPNGTTGSCDSIEVKTKDGAIRRKVSLHTSTGRITIKFCEREAC